MPPEKPTFNTPLYIMQTAICAACVIAVLMWRTDGFAHYTYESTRRANIASQPITVSDWVLQNGNGKAITLSEINDKTLLIDFIFTRCPTLCQALGTRYQQLQQLLDRTDTANVLLLSISIDPAYDTPSRLRDFRSLHRGQEGSWKLARPANDQQLRNMMAETGLRVVPDKIGGFSHSDSIHVVQHGTLIEIIDRESTRLEQIILQPGN